MKMYPLFFKRLCIFISNTFIIVKSFVCFVFFPFIRPAWIEWESSCVCMTERKEQCFFFWSLHALLWASIYVCTVVWTLWFSVQIFLMSKTVNGKWLVLSTSSSLVQMTPKCFTLHSVIHAHIHTLMVLSYIVATWGRLTARLPYNRPLLPLTATTSKQGVCSGHDWDQWSFGFKPATHQLCPVDTARFVCIFLPRSSHSDSFHTLVIVMALKIILRDIPALLL